MLALTHSLAHSAVCIPLPEAAPQQGATHQAEENMLLRTSGGKRVTFRCTCSRLSTSARKTPTEKSMALRTSRLVVLEGNWVHFCFCQLSNDLSTHVGLFFKSRDYWKRHQSKNVKKIHWILVQTKEMDFHGVKTPEITLQIPTPPHTYVVPCQQNTPSMLLALFDIL